MKRLIYLSIPFIVAVLLLGVTLQLASASSRLITGEEAKGNIIVNTLEDELNDDGDCSLREAIEAANTNATVDACAAGDVLTDTINFDVAGSITVTSQLEVVNGGPLVIDGGGVITTSGGGTTRVWWVGDGSHLIIEQLAVADGSALYIGGPGLVNNSGVVIIRDSYFANNHTEDSCGAIHNLGEMRIFTSTFINNSAGDINGGMDGGIGGGICNGSILFITGSTFSGNTADYGAGGIDSSGTLTITNSTFSGNQAYAAGGAIIFQGSLYITESTFNNNLTFILGGGIVGNGNLEIIGSSLYANHSNDTAGGIVNVGAMVISNSNFLDNTADNYVGAILNDGTMTITQSTVSGNLAAYDGSIYNEGILVISGSNIINNTGYYTGGGLYNDGSMVISGTNITGNSSSVGGGLYNLGTVVITDSTISENRASTNGGAIYNEGVVGIENSILSLNQAQEGGAIYSLDSLEGNLSIINSTFDNNQAEEIGGAIIASYTMISNTIFSNNSAGAWGGAVFMGQSNVNNSLFSGNTSNSWGGAIYSGGPITITLTSFYGNEALNGGGAIFSGEDPVVIHDSSFYGNQAYESGGAINGIDYTVIDSTIFNNVTDGAGGGIFGMTVTLTNTTIYSNSAGESGGGIWVDSIANINNCTISGNSSNSIGGGIYSLGSAHLSNTIVANNLSGGDCNAAIIDEGHNLDSDGTCGLDPDNGSLPNTNPLLGPLQDNGGSTWTQALLLGSPAIDAGDNVTCAITDQRGVPRPQDGNGDGISLCDMGAYEREFQPVAPELVSITGENAGFVEQDYLFTAIVEPISTTHPLTYTWQASEQIPITHTGGLTDTISFSWELTGTKEITVTSSNMYGIVTANHVITLTDEPISGLVANNDSPTLIGSATTLYSTIETGTNVSYTWDFGDGEAGAGPSILHTYPAVGLFTATLTATNSVNSMSDTTVVTIVDVPIEGLSASNDSPTLLGNPTTFIAVISSGTNVTFSWDFGDGFLGEGEVISHTYSAPGLYTATVTATNSANYQTAVTQVNVIRPENNIYLPLVSRYIESPQGSELSGVLSGQFTSIHRRR